MSDTVKNNKNMAYRKNQRAQIVIDVSKAQRQQINDFCRDKGGTATYIKELLRDDMRRHGVRPLEASEAYVSDGADESDDQ
ncbi:MAG: hypothetical protein Q4E13_09365 [Clostridia bacterium]|nr:hypothetical protein [Clostridia bacterium]